MEQAQSNNEASSGTSALSAGLERPVLCVRPHRHRELLKLPEELEVGWLRGGHFWGFAACKNAAAFDALCEDLRKHHGEIDISDMRSNAELWGEEPIGGASRTNAVLGAAVPPAQAFSKD